MWSGVEFSLSILFDAILDTRRPVAHATLAAVRSFDARLKMIGDAFNARFPDKDSPPRPDWKLLYNTCSSYNALRNQVAHALHIVASHNGEVKPTLEPYFVLTQEKSRIDAAEVNLRTAKFHSLRACIDWLIWAIEHPEPPTGFEREVPHLLLQLRDEAAQRRAKQQRPRRSSRP